MTVGQLARAMSHREFVEWRTWYGLEPRGDERADWRAGWLGLLLAAINSKRRDRGELKWHDFVPRFRAPPPPTPADVSDQVRAVFGAFKRKGKG